MLDCYPMLLPKGGLSENRRAAGFNENRPFAAYLCDAGESAGERTRTSKAARPPAPKHLPWVGAADFRRLDAPDDARRRPHRNPASLATRSRASYGLPMILRCTARLLDLLGGPALTLAGTPVSDDDWYANLVWLDRRKCLLLTHADTLFPIFIADVPQARPATDRRLTSSRRSQPRFAKSACRAAHSASSIRTPSSSPAPRAGVCSA